MKKIFSAVIALMMTVSVPAQFYIYLSNGEVLQADSISLVAPSSEGVLSGKFSVSAMTQVQFSQGNLQYQASTDTWRFAENQYDTIGGANSNISASYTGWIDLFSWGTGSNPTVTSADDYDFHTFIDWGVNKISNGGNKANLWRTLTSDEWNYLFCGRPNAATLFGLGSVNGVNGLVILPDNWTLPAGGTFTASTTQGLVLAGNGTRYNSNGNNFSDNTYTAEQWSKMESAGAVFLPAAGYRYDTNVDGVGTYGLYWSATYDRGMGRCHLSFSSDYLIPIFNISPVGDYDPNIGISVRLVR